MSICHSYILFNATAHSGLLKLWLRDLREPLCTTGMFGSFIGAVSEDAEVHEKSVEVCFAKDCLLCSRPLMFKIPISQMIAGLIPLLPQYERFALHELILHLSRLVQYDFLIQKKIMLSFFVFCFCWFLFEITFECRVAAHSAQNNMNVENLAIVVGPNILKTPEITSGGNVHKTYQRIFKVVELMIRHVDVVFANVGEQRRALLEAAKDEAMREVRQRIQNAVCLKLIFVVSSFCWYFLLQRLQFASVRKQTVPGLSDTNSNNADTTSGYKTL